ncbi:hypothetical protein R3I94_011495 [Phoxinus phoxinus]
MRLLSHRDLHSLTKYQIILAREQFRRNPPPHVQGPQQGPIEGDFALCISLYHGYELLQQMGIRSLFLFIQNIFSGPKESSRARNELQRSPVFMDLYREMETMFATSSRGPQDPYVYSHPKLQKLDEVVLRHFQSQAESSDSEVSTRVMIFSSFRESVQEIAEMLNRHQPLVKVMTFMGQASAGKGVRGFTQKEQLEVVRRFREGGFNTLVSTCVGEEGLDIGEVDLIVCFDAQKSPIRLVQRMGRTGRRRQGRIVVILAEGREERTYNQSQSNRRSINKSIMGNKHSFQMFAHSPRMLPAGVTPALHKMLISVGQFEQRDASRRSTKGRRSSLSLQTAGGEQSCVKDEGFLSAAEEVVWRSTMRLGEDEAQPVFRPASLLTFSDPPSEQEPSVSGPVRELSLWEWRHWQNRPLHTHRVGHSERCLHFTNIMELIDRLRQEEQGDSSFEPERALHPQEEEVQGGRTTKPNGGTIPRKKRSKPHAASRSADQREEDGRTSVRPIPSAESRLDTHERVDPESDPSSQHECLDCLLGDPEDESSDLQHMFYQPEQDISPKRCRHSLTTKAFQRILADVEDLLSRSPPQEFLLPDLGVFPTDTVSDVFQVTFSLASANREREDPEALSPGWDELFDDDEAFTRVEEEREEHREDHQEKQREREEHREKEWEEHWEEHREKESEEHWEKECKEQREKHQEEHQEKKREEHREKEREEHREEHQEEHREEHREKESEEHREEHWEKEWKEQREKEREKEQEEHREKEREEHREKEREEHREKEREEHREKEREEHREEQDSLDLFGDDEAFLQLSVPDIRTPDKSTGPEGEQVDEQDTGSDQAFHCSQDFFSVNFDLGFESEEEECVDATSRPAAGTVRSELSLVSDQWSPAPRPSASTPIRVLPGQARGVLPGQATPSLRTELFHRGLSSAGGVSRGRSAGVLSSDSEGETPLRTSAQKADPVVTPEQSKICSDVESPVQARRKPAAALDTSEDSDDFQEVSAHRPRDVKPRRGRKPHVLRREGRQFLDEEAELSEDEEVSTDEDDGDEQNRSLQGFVVNATQCSQGLNDSEMQAFYLKSVRSPAVPNPVRLTYKPKHNINVFSQVPEQDETYAEDSFVFDGSEEEEESVCDEEPVELIPEDSSADGRKLYATRRRVRIRAASAAVQPERSKRSRIVRVQEDSSEEEEECEGPDSVFKVPQCLQKRQRLSDQASLPEEPDCHSEKPVSESTRSVSDAPLRVLVDGRCISAGSEVVSRLRLRHGLQVQVCSLVSADFIVSSRMCVEWQSEAEVSSAQNRRRLTERIQRLQEEYERVCVIVQSERCKPGEAARVFQRSRYYDGTLAALVKAGVRLLVSNGPDQTASILSDLTHVESRKGQAIDVPLEVKGHRQQALQFCLTLPNVSYITALNMCHRYSSVGHMIRSSVQDLQACACVSRSRAEGIYRCLRYSYCC